jgi:hypothetical protein
LDRIHQDQRSVTTHSRLTQSPQPPQRTGVNTTEGKTGPQTLHGVSLFFVIRSDNASLRVFLTLALKRNQFHVSDLDRNWNRLSYQARLGRSWSQMWSLQSSSSLPAPCPTDLDRSRAQRGPEPDTRSPSLTEREPEAASARHQTRRD